MLRPHIRSDMARLTTKEFVTVCNTLHLRIAIIVKLLPPMIKNAVIIFRVKNRGESSSTLIIPLPMSSLILLLVTIRSAVAFKLISVVLAFMKTISLVVFIVIWTWTINMSKISLSNLQNKDNWFIKLF